MEYKAGVKLHNKFEMYVKKKDEKTEKLVGTAYNIILNDMWASIIHRGHGLFGFIAYGRGTGILSPDRTELFSQIARASATNVEEVFSKDSGYMKKKIELSPSTAVGETITELGIGTNFSSYTHGMLTHALLKDSEGNPISFTKTDTDIVTIYATLYYSITLTPPLRFSKQVPEDNFMRYLFWYGSKEVKARLGRNPLPHDENSEEVFGDSLPIIKAATKTGYNLATATETYKVRFEASEGNIFIGEIGIFGLASVTVPKAGIIDKVLYENVSLGVGDGSTKEFYLPSPYIEEPLVNIKVNSTPKPYTLKKLPRIAYLGGSDINGGHVPNAYYPNYEPASIYPMPWDNKWLSIGDGKIRYGIVDSRGSLHQKGFITAAATLTSTRPIFFNTGKICALQGDVFVDYSGDQPILIASKFNGINPSTGVLTDDDVFLIYADNTNGYIRLAKKGQDGKYTRVGSSQAGDKYSKEYVNVALTEDNTHAYFAGSSGLSIVRLNIEDETIMQEVHSGENGHIACEYNGKIYAFRYGTYKIYSKVNGVFSLESSGNISYNVGLVGGGLVGEGLCFITSSNPSTGKFVELLPNGVAVRTPKETSPPVYTGSYNIVVDGGPIIYVGYNYFYTACPIRIDNSEIYVVLDTAPASGEVVTATYKTNGIHKSNQYVLDVTFSVTYAEGVI